MAQTRRKLCRRRFYGIHVAANAAAISSGWEDDTDIAAPRCYLVPSDSGDGLDQICISEGKLNIGAAESDYYFTANTGLSIVV